MSVAKAEERQVNMMNKADQSTVAAQDQTDINQGSLAAKQMLTVPLESSFSKTFCAWSGGNLRMEVITLAIVCQQRASQECRRGVNVDCLPLSPIHSLSLFQHLESTQWHTFFVW